MEKQTRMEAVQNRQVAASFDSLELANEFEGGRVPHPEPVQGKQPAQNQKGTRPGVQSWWASADWGRYPQ